MVALLEHPLNVSAVEREGQDADLTNSGGDCLEIKEAELEDDVETVVETDEERGSSAGGEEKCGRGGAEELEL